MAEPYKLRIKLPDAGFNGEGPEDRVRTDYQAFLDAYKLSRGTAALAGPALTSPPHAAVGVADALLQKAFLVKDDIVSLRHLPPSDSSARAADAAILLLYGFKNLSRLEDVPVTKLNEALRDSGLTLDRIDRYIGIHASLYRKGGQRAEGRYSLTNPGEAQAEKWLKE